jgi:hypothetical protein
MKKTLREVIRRVEFWPEERQENAVRILLEMEAQVRSPHQLTAEQAHDVKRRLADLAPQFISLQEARSRFAKHGA